MKPTKLLRILTALLAILAATTATAREEALHIVRPWGTMHGTLLVPETGSDAVVLLIAGSGPTDRNGNSGGMLPTNSYLLLARALEEAGIASLRYDKRGIGASRFARPEEFRQEELRFEDFIEDAAAWIAPLREQGFRRIVLAGHSEGALIALEVAAARPDEVTAVVSLAGAGYPIDEILLAQLGRELISFNPGLLLRAQSIIARIKAGESVTDVPPLLQPVFPTAVQPYLSSWMRYDPRRSIRRVTQPLLILNGDNDIQIPTDNAEALAAAQPAARKIIVKGMTHLLKTSDITDPQQQKIAHYTDSSLPISEELAAHLTAFVREL